MTNTTTNAKDKGDNNKIKKCVSCDDYILDRYLKELCRNCDDNYEVIIFGGQVKKLFGLTDEDIENKNLFCVEGEYKRTKRTTKMYLIKEIEELASKITKDLPDNDLKKILYLKQKKIKDDKKKAEEYVIKRKKDIKNYVELLLKKYDKTLKEIFDIDKKEDYVKYVIHEYSICKNRKIVESINKISSHIEKLLKFDIEEDMDRKEEKEDEIQNMYTCAIDSIHSYYFDYYKEEDQKERLKQVFDMLKPNGKNYLSDEIFHEKIIKKYVLGLDGITLADIEKYYKKKMIKAKRNENFLFHEWEDWRKIADQKLGDLGELDYKSRKIIDIKLFKLGKNNYFYDLNYAHFGKFNSIEHRYINFRCSQLFLIPNVFSLYKSNTNKITVNHRLGVLDKTKIGPIKE